MKNTILGFNQIKLLEYDLDLKDVLIIRYIIDFRGTGKMIEEIHNKKVYYWINYKKLLEDIPILNISKDMLRRRLKKIVEKGILIHFTKKQNGTYSFYNIGKNYLDLLINENNNTSKKNDRKNLKSHKEKVNRPYGKLSGIKDLSTKDQSIKHNNNNSKKNVVVEKEEAKKLNNIANDICIKFKEIAKNYTLNKYLIINLIKKVGKKIIYKYLNSWNKYMQIKNMYHPSKYFYYCVKNKTDIFSEINNLAYAAPGSTAPGNNYKKPSQSYNFEQRQYTDDFFDSLYDNF